MKPATPSNLLSLFFAAAVFATGIVYLESGRIGASSFLGAVQFGLVCTIALAVFTSYRK